MLLAEKAAPGRLQSSCVSGTTAPHAPVHQACPVLTLVVSLSPCSAASCSRPVLLFILLVFAVPHSS